MGKVKLTPAKADVEEKASKLVLTPAELDETDNGLSDTLKDTAYGVAQGATFNLADEGYGATKSLYEKGDLSEYEKHRDAAREEWANARERTPVGTVLGEVGGAIVSPANKILGAGQGLKGVLRGAVEGAAQSYGASDKDKLSDQMVDSAKGAGLGAAVGGVTNLVTKRYSKSPNATRAEVLGVKQKDYLVDGPADRKKIVERINDTGMLKNRKMEYDADQMKFVPRGKSKFQIDELEKNTEERLLGRAQDAVTKLQNKKEQYYGKLLDNRYVSHVDIDQMANEISDEFSKRGLVKGPMARNEAASKLRENIYDQLMMNGSSPDMTKFKLRDLDMVKRMAQEDVKNFSKGLNELGDGEELARITARKLKNLVEDRIGDEGFKKINSAQHDFLSVTGDLKNRIKGLDLAVPGSSQVNKTSMLEKGIDGIFGGSQGRLDAAARKEWYEGVMPKPARAVIPYAAEEAPGVLYRQNLEGQEIKGNWRNPSSVPNIPEQFIRTPLPRSTQGLMQNKNFVLGKVAQMMPEMFEAVKDTYEHEPEMLGEIAQVLAMKMPYVFERDKYNRFDGRILAETDKQKAIKDTLLRKDISSIDQAKIITKLNQEGIFEG